MNAMTMTIDTTPTHNISDPLLMSYATGSLPQAFDLVVASHVSLSDDSRARLAGHEALGGAVLENMDEANLAEDSLDAVMQMIDSGRPAQRDIWVSETPATLPEPLRRVVGGDVDAVEWRSLGMGIKQAILHEDENGTARLLSIPAGAEMPKHSHRGMEMTLVLQGAYRDEHDRFARGDIEVAGEDIHHTPVAEMGQDCICLIATDARLKFDGLLPRIAQPFIGI